MICWNWSAYGFKLYLQEVDDLSLLEGLDWLSVTPVDATRT